MAKPWSLGTASGSVSRQSGSPRRGGFESVGPVGVFGARFVTGLRFLAGPLAGSGGLRPLPFFVANILGALVYVPLTVGEGYAAAYGLGDYPIRIHRGIAGIEQVLLSGVLFGLFLLLGWRLRHHWQARYKLAQNAPRLDPDATKSSSNRHRSWGPGTPCSQSPNTSSKHPHLPNPGITISTEHDSGRTIDGVISLQPYPLSASCPN